MISESIGAEGPAFVHRVRTIEAEKPTKLTVYLGTEHGLELWLNQRRVFSNPTLGNGLHPKPDQATVELPLVAGKNQLLMKLLDHRNRLVKVTHYAAEGGPADQVVEHAYDTQNRWIKRSVDADGDGPGGWVDTHFVYNGSQIILEFEDADGPGPNEPELSHRYLWGPAVDQVLADEQVDSLLTPGEVLWPLCDHIGTVRDLASFDDQTQTTQVVNHTIYDAFGRKTSETNAAIDHLFAFSGRPFDETTGLQNNLNRWYDPTTGRWLSEDPIGFEAGDANLMRYVGNQSTMVTDPNGQQGKVVTKPVTKKITTAIIRKLVRKRLLQLHHIITRRMFRPDRALGKWLSGLVGQEAAPNLIYLPTLKRGEKKLAQRAAERIAQGKSVSPARRALAAYAKRAGHEGRHLGRYVKDVQKRLAGVMARHQAGAIDDAAAKAEIAAIQAEIREGLETGVIILQKVEQAQLKAGAMTGMGGLAVIVPMSQKDWDAKVKEFEAFVEKLIEPQMMDGMRVEDWAPGLKILDWINPLDLYASAEEIGRAFRLKADGEEILTAKMDELGLLPPPEQIVHLKTIALILETWRETGKLPSQEEQDYIDKCLERRDVGCSTPQKNVVRVWANVKGERYYKDVDFNK